MESLHIALIRFAPGHLPPFVNQAVVKGRLLATTSTYHPDFTARLRFWWHESSSTDTLRSGLVHQVRRARLAIITRWRNRHDRGRYRRACHRGPAAAPAPSIRARPAHVGAVGARGETSWRPVAPCFRIIRVRDFFVWIPAKKLWMRFLAALLDVLVKKRPDHLPLEARVVVCSGLISGIRGSQPCYALVPSLGAAHRVVVADTKGLIGSGPFLHPLHGASRRPPAKASSTPEDTPVH